MMRFTDRTVLVTGGGGNIGSACARRLAAEGASVVVVDLDGGAAEAVAQAITAQGGTALGIGADVTDRSLVGQVFDQAEELGPVDVIVNSAGVFALVDAVDISDEEWERVMDTNLRSPFLYCQEAVRRWTDAGSGGSIVNVASIESTTPFPRQVHYAASKGGVAMLTKALALDLADHGIRVNAVGPGTIPRPGREAQAMAELGHQYPLGRLGTADDVAAGVAFLASEDAAWITGQILYIDGGRLVR